MSEYQPFYTNSHALVIGINEYSTMWPLQTAVFGAETVGKVLHEDYDFNISLLRDKEATRDGILEAFNHYRDTKPDDRLIIYFSGHGATITDYLGNKSGLLVPYGVGKKEYHLALEMDELIKLSRYVPAKHILYLIDSCFSGMAISRTSELDDPVYEDLITRRGVIAIAAGMEDQEVADIGPDNHSPFTGVLLERLAQRKGFLTGIRLGIYLQDNVKRRTQHQQTPHFGRHSGQGGDFIFSAVEAKLLPEWLIAAAESNDTTQRLIAVNQLLKFAQSEDEAEEAFARLEILATDNNTVVRSSAQAALSELTPEPEIAPQEPEPPVVQPPMEPQQLPKPLPWAWIGGIAAVVVIGIIIGVIALSGGFGAGSNEATETPPTEEAAVVTETPTEVEVEAEATPTAEDTPTPLHYVEGKILFEDNFEGGDTSEWYTYSGWSIAQDGTSNRVFQADADDWTRALGSDTWEDYIFEVKALISEVGSYPHGQFGCIFRGYYQDHNYILDFRKNELVLIRSELQGYGYDEWTEIARTSYDLPIEEWINIRIEVAEQTTKVYIDGNRYLLYTDPVPLLKGRIGFYVQEGNIVWFDDVRVIELVPEEN